MAAGVVAISGTLAMLLPTSIALVIFGLLADVSISKLLVSGIVPAMIVTGAIVITILILIWRDPSRAPLSSSTPWHKKFALLWSVGADGAAVLARDRRHLYGRSDPDRGLGRRRARRLPAGAGAAARDGQELLRAFRHAAYGSCMIAMILLGASIFSYAFTLTQITQNLVAWVGGLAAADRWRSSRSSCAAISCSARSWTRWPSWC